MPTPQERGESAGNAPKAEAWTKRAQHARALAIQNAMRKAQAAHPRENAPKAGQIRSLGLIGKDEDTKQTLGQS
jgi:hypothetical protein